jgi:hypothetical protein
MWPDCFVQYTTCDNNYILHLTNHIQICGIITGMLLWGGLADITCRKWGSRSVAAIVLSGAL